MSELKSKVGSGKVENPTRREAVTAFIWKSMMKSVGNNSNSKLLQCFGQAVNLWSLMGQRLSKELIGNLVAVAVVSCNENIPEIKDLVGLLRDGVAGVDENYLNSISGEKGFEAMVEGQKSMSELAGGQQVLISSSWSGFGFNDFDFGLGSPVWTGVAGDFRCLGNHVALGNSIVLKELRARGDGRGKEIEAWIRMDKGVMDVLERDAEFLKFASANPTEMIMWFNLPQ
ncbi:BAHD acyltransferase BIA1 [Linum perenne]